MRRGPSSSAFTLVELLLVIAITSLLLGILLPALVKTKANAVALQCQARLGQLMIGSIMHADDHKDRLPYPNWRSALCDDSQPGWLYTSPVENWDGEARKTGTLWSYLQAPDVYRCQAHRAEQDGSAVITSYLMNGAVIAFGDPVRAPRPFRLDQFKSKDAIFWDAEDVDPDLDSGLGGDRSDGATWPGALPRARHLNAINVAVIDGAVMRMPMTVYQNEQVRGPSMLWCVPNSKTGD